MVLPDADTLSTEFTIILREWLPLSKLDEIDRLNAAETDSSICHSHDFCDPNQAMIDAFTRFGVEYDTQNDLHHKISQAAWAVAKKVGFNRPFTLKAKS